jgi:DivIVA domain-containing protein
MGNAGVMSSASHSQEGPDEAREEAGELGREADLGPAGGLGGSLATAPTEIRDVAFATSVRGYHRGQVDSYVERVNRVIAELEVGHSPQSAVKHALDRVGEQTAGVLQRAREVAEELTTTALAESEHATRRAKVEAEELIGKAQDLAERLQEDSSRDAEEMVALARERAQESVKQAEERVRLAEEQAQARLRVLQQEIQAATEARRELLEELRATAVELEEFAGGALARHTAGPAAKGAADAPTETLPARTAAGAARARAVAEGDDQQSAEGAATGDEPQAGSEAEHGTGAQGKRYRPASAASRGSAGGETRPRPSRAGASG